MIRMKSHPEIPFKTTKEGTCTFLGPQGSSASALAHEHQDVRRNPAQPPVSQTLQDLNEVVQATRLREAQVNLYLKKLRVGFRV